MMGPDPAWFSRVRAGFVTSAEPPVPGVWAAPGGGTPGKVFRWPEVQVTLQVCTCQLLVSGLYLKT